MYKSERHKDITHSNRTKRNEQKNSDILNKVSNEKCLENNTNESLCNKMDNCINKQNNINRQNDINSQNSVGSQNNRNHKKCVNKSRQKYNKIERKKKKNASSLLGDNCVQETEDTHHEKSLNDDCLNMEQNKEIVNDHLKEIEKKNSDNEIKADINDEKLQLERDYVIEAADQNKDALTLCVCVEEDRKKYVTKEKVNEKDMKGDNNEKDMEYDNNKKDMEYDQDEKDMEYDQDVKDIEGDNNKKDMEDDKNEKDMENDNNKKDMEGDKNEKDMEGDNNKKDMEGDKNEKDMEGDKNEKDMEGDNNKKDMEGDKNEKDMEGDNNKKDMEGDNNKKDMEGDKDAKDIICDNNITLKNKIPINNLNDNNIVCNYKHRDTIEEADNNYGWRKYYTSE
ncbi:glutamic acid-rich protein [Plasmodium falciparum RAJ116]|uniref:Glutamic acid-rich protein n=1 Tax=Plasmodium falciparum RAJ116 TaxID=580058 RepID=A0A0L0CX59_PLAFA|nr:glutamic acid-rich protein [Plasmodium falciparum RAJ116]